MNTDNTHSGDIDAGRVLVLDPATIDPEHPGAAHNADLYVRRGIEVTVNGQPAPSMDDEALAATSPAIMVAEVEGRIAQLQKQLAANTGFNPATGEPVPLVQGRARENAERELAVLTHTTLPYTKMRAAEIEAAKAAMPTTAEKLQAEKDHNERVRARAEELALEAEATEMAERIRKAARAQSFG